MQPTRQSSVWPTVMRAYGCFRIEGFWFGGVSDYGAGVEIRTVLHLGLGCMSLMDDKGRIWLFWGREFTDWERVSGFA